MLRLCFCLFLWVFVFLIACQEGDSSQPSSTATLEIALSFADSRTGQWTNFRNPNFIYDLAVDKKGIVWTIGANGVLRYDSNTEEARYFTIQDGLPDNDNYNLALAQDGTVWILSQGQLVSFDGNKWQTLSRTDTPDDFRPFTMAIAPNGDIWFLESWDTVRKFDRQIWEEMHVGEANNFIRVAVDGRIWIAGRQLLSYDGHRWTEHSYPPSTVGTEGLFIYDFIVDMQNNIWLTIGSTDRFPTLYKYDENTWRDFVITDETAFRVYLGKIWADPIEGIWYVSDRGSPGFDVYLTHFVDEEQHVVHSIGFPGLLAKSFWGFAAQPDGSFWFGSQGHTQWGSTPPGIYHFSGNLWEQLIMPASIPDNRINSCARTDDGRLWFSTGSGLVNFNGQSWENLTSKAGLPEATSLLLPGSDNTLWVSDSYGLTHFGSQIRQFRGELFSLPGIISIATNDGQTIWFGGYDGSVWHFDGREFINYPLPFQEGYYSLEALTVAPDDRVWVGFSQGNIFELDGDSWQNISLDDFTSVYAMNFAENELWAVIRRRDSKVPNIYTYDGTSWLLHDITIFNESEKATAILNVTDGTVWLGTNDGIIKYDPSDDSARRLTIEDGLVDNAVSSLCEGQDGSIWVGTRAGLSRYESQSSRDAQGDCVAFPQLCER